MSLLESLMTVVLGSSVVTAFINWLMNRPKIAAEARKLNGEADEILFKRYEALVNEHENTIKELRTEKTNWLSERVGLTDQISKLNENYNRINDNYKKMEATISYIADILVESLSEESKNTPPFKAIFDKIQDLKQ